MFEKFIGIDPGQDGGIACLITGRAVATKMPATERDIHDYFWQVCCPGSYTIVAIEQVHSFPGTGPKCPLCKKPRHQQGVASSFKFGQGYGFLRGVLVGRVRYEDVTPQRWQKEFGLIVPAKRGLTPTQKKNLHKQKAQQLFPQLTITHAIADALLIAEAARRWWGNQAAEAVGSE